MSREGAAAVSSLARAHSVPPEGAPTSRPSRPPAEPPPPAARQAPPAKRAARRPSRPPAEPPAERAARQASRPSAEPPAERAARQASRPSAEPPGKRAARRPSRPPAEPPAERAECAFGPALVGPNAHSARAAPVGRRAIGEITATSAERQPCAERWPEITARNYSERVRACASWGPLVRQGRRREYRICPQVLLLLSVTSPVRIACRACKRRTTSHLADLRVGGSGAARSPA